MADRYWVGGSAAWDATAGSKWSATSGGSGGQAVPTVDDDVHFDASSGSGTVTGAAQSCKSLNFTGFTGTFTMTGTLSIVGGLTLGSTATINANPYMSGGSDLYSNGNTINGDLLISSSTVTIQDALVVAGSVTVLTLNSHGAGATLVANDCNVTAGSFVFDASSTLYDLTVTMGSGTWTATGTGTGWSVLQLVGTITVTPSTSTIKFTNNSSSDKTFAGGGKTYNNFWNATEGSGSVIISGSNTFNDFKINPGRTQKFTDGTTQTITSLSGTDLTAATIMTGTSSAGWAISKSSGVVAAHRTTISYSTASGGATFLASTDWLSVNGGNNSGWSFSRRPKLIAAIVA